MIEDFSDFKKDFKNASKLGKEIKINIQKFDKIILCGIGGSAVAGEVIKLLNLKIPVFVARENLPKFADKKTLCFVTSYSGETSETIRLYKQAKIKKCKVIVISSGGKLGNSNEEKIIIPKNYLPREAFIWMLLPVLNILNIDYGISFNINSKEILKIARKIKNKIPFIYAGSEDLKFLSYRWKTFFNENTKIPAHSNYFPELAHNEIEAKLNKKYKIILIYVKKTKQIKEYRKMTSQDIIEVKLKGNSFIDRIIYGLYFGFILSYYLSKLYGVNFSDEKNIDELKKRLK